MRGSMDGEHTFVEREVFVSYASIEWDNGCRTRLSSRVNAVRFPI